MKFLDILTIATIGSLNIYNHSYAATPTGLVRLSPIQRVAVAVEPQSSEDYVERGQAKFDAKDYQGAIVEYTRAIEINPESAAAYWGRSNAKFGLLMKTDPGFPFDTDSVNDASKYIQLMSDSGLYLKNGDKKFKDKDYLGAISDLDRVIKISYSTFLIHEVQSTFAKSVFQQCLCTPYSWKVLYAPHTDRAYLLRGMVKLRGFSRKEDALRDVEYAAERLRKRGNTDLYNTALKVIKQIKESS